MSVRCLNWVLDSSPATGNDRLVLIAIADEADDDGRNAFPGLPRISHKSRVPVRTCIRCIARLEAGGELLVRRPDTPGRGRHNRYVVAMGRDPDALAGEVGWPPPPLDPDVRTKWCHDGTLSPGDNPGDNPVGDDGEAVDDRRERPRKRANGPLETCHAMAPDPLTLKDPRAFDVAVCPQVDDDAERGPVPAGDQALDLVATIRAAHFPHRAHPAPPDDEQEPAL